MPFEIVIPFFVVMIGLFLCFDERCILLSFFWLILLGFYFRGFFIVILIDFISILVTIKCFAVYCPKRVVRFVGTMATYLLCHLVYLTRGATWLWVAAPVVSGPRMNVAGS